MNTNLQPVQFGGISAPVERPHETHSSESSRPLALGSQTAGSVNQAAVWHKPDKVLPYSAATMGSTFKPY